jgi:tetratricopeptide (TPR) repeat protein
MSRPQEITLAEATTHIVNTCARHRRPFFFMVGAGVSFPPIPLAPHVIEACRKQCPGSEVPKDLDPMREYSWWFQRAFHSPADRQWYLRSLIEKQSVSHANLRLAHLLLSKKISNLVVTTNFDDFVSKSLTIFGEPHIVCDHPDTIQRIDAENDDLQIVHVHGTYWFYDCCNLEGELEARSRKSPQASSMADFLDRVLSNRSPLIMGYSGWSGDVFVNALRRRLNRELPYNIYWFCYQRSMIQSLPDDVKGHPNVFFVVPEQANVQARKVGAGEKLPEPTLPASEVLEALVSSFQLEAPPLTRDPLGFFAQQLRNSLPPDDATSVRPDLYLISKVIRRIERARQNLTVLEAALESVRDAVRRSQYSEAVGLAIAVGDKGDDDQRKELTETLCLAGPKLPDTSPEKLAAWEQAVKLGEALLRRDPKDLQVQEWVAKALVSRSNLIGKDALPVYDEVVARFGSSTQSGLRYQVARAIHNKAATQYEENDGAAASATYALLVTNFGDAPEPEIRGLVARALYHRAITEDGLGHPEVEQKLFEEILERFETETPPACREVVVLTLNGMADNIIDSAKALWLEGREPEAMERLKGARSLLARAAERAPDNAYVLGTDAYLTFLLGDVPRAAELLTQAVQFGGEDLRRAELASAQHNLLPVDERFIRMIEDVAGAGGLAVTV